ncbi:response regulator transcription factor [Flaviaesturariibacter flavus]|uniref:Response regulator transcription factor n=1 Tax=Flaviaesturariibacter flavus TaxID=2502780 RepID=A0A4R1B9K3_9BACT|nr:LytTR family DNA-binding domain-containing protein [Flaviaesturariibacter flavus]TCJ13600.1 response regulator transcription factor [Flaviaesturariibacter flavus]
MPAERYTCLIADDSMIDRDLLELHISKIGALELVAVCANGLEAANILRGKPVDIVFSDIDMPELSGMELIQSLQNPPVFIFISAHPEHAAESFNLDIIDFIVKPVTLPRVMKAAEKAITYLRLKKEQAAPGATGTETAAPDAGDNYFYIKEGTGYVQVAYADVLYIESMGNFSRIQTVSGKKLMTLVGLKNMEQQLPATEFLRVHKQYIVNLRHIVSLSADGQITMRNDEPIATGSLYRAKLLELVNRRTLQR